MTEHRPPRQGDIHRSDPYLPDKSTDESDLGWGELPEDAAREDERLLREKPPHYL